MSLVQHQKRVDDWAQAYELPYWAPLSQFARMVEEVGELGRILNHRYGDKVKKASEKPDDLEDELGDVLLTVILLANSEGIDLDQAFEKVLHKAKTRDKNRHAKK